MKLFGNKKREASPKGQKKKKKTRRMHPAFVVLLCIGLIAMSAGLWLKWGIAPPDGNTPILNTAEPDDEIVPQAGDFKPQVSFQPVAKAERKKDFYTLVLMGMDPEGYNTDVMMVAALDVTNGQLHVINVPRDTQVAGKNGSIRKINASWSIGLSQADGKESGGAEQINADLGKIIGFQPGNYILVDMKGFIRLVDALGGVRYTVPRNMYHYDPIESRLINLKKGDQKLNGQKALQLVRFRSYPEGDLKRIEVQQDFLKTLAKQTLSLGNVFKIPEFIDNANDNVKTSYSVTDMIWFAQQIMNLNADNIHFYTLEGDASAYYKKNNYVLLDKDKVLELVNKTINPFTQDIQEDNLQLSAVFDYKQ